MTTSSVTERQETTSASASVGTYLDDCERALLGGSTGIFRSLFEFSGLCIAFLNLGQRVVHANNEVTVLRQDGRTSAGQLTGVAVPGANGQPELIMTLFAPDHPTVEKPFAVTTKLLLSEVRASSRGSRRVRRGVADHRSAPTAAAPGR